MAGSLLKIDAKKGSKVLAIAAAHGKRANKMAGIAEPAATDSPSMNEKKTVRIEEILNGFKVILGDSYPTKEAHAKDWPEACQIAGAYMGENADTNEGAGEEG